MANTEPVYFKFEIRPEDYPEGCPILQLQVQGIFGANVDLLVSNQFVPINQKGTVCHPFFLPCPLALPLFPASTEEKRRPSIPYVNIPSKVV
jgi:hypothetical protein